MKVCSIFKLSFRPSVTPTPTPTAAATATATTAVVAAAAAAAIGQQFSYINVFILNTFRIRSC